MKIFDFANIRRAYIMHKACKEAGVTYRFHLHSGRTSIKLDPFQTSELQAMAPYAMSDLADQNDLCKEINNSDILLINSFVHSKDSDREFYRLLDGFGGKVVNVDYAWDTYKKHIPIAQRAFKRAYAGIAIAVDYTSSHFKPVFNWSQPEIDMSVHRDEWASIGTPPPGFDGVFLLTPGRNFLETDILAQCIREIQKHCKKPYVYLKFKQKDSPEMVNHGRRVLRRMDVLHSITDESHKGLANYCVLYALQSHAHINLDPQSFSNLEVMRAGVPTFEMNKQGLVLPHYYRSALRQFWDQESIKDIYENIDLSKKKRARLSVGPLHCANNLLKNLESLS